MPSSPGMWFRRSGGGQWVARLSTRLGLLLSERSRRSSGGGRASVWRVRLPGSGTFTWISKSFCFSGFTARFPVRRFLPASSRLGVLPAVAPTCCAADRRVLSISRCSLVERCRASSLRSMGVIVSVLPEVLESCHRFRPDPSRVPPVELDQGWNVESRWLRTRFGLLSGVVYRPSSLESALPAGCRDRVAEPLLLDLHEREVQVVFHWILLGAVFAGFSWTAATYSAIWYVLQFLLGSLACQLACFGTPTSRLEPDL